MNHYPINLFRTSCGATDPLELNVSGPGWAGGQRRVFDQPFVLVGRDERNSLQLDAAPVSRRHAYLQQLGGRVFCVDLGSRNGTRWGGERRPAGWLCPDQGIQIGSFTLEPAMAAQAGGGPRDEVAADWDPLQDRANDPRLLPLITVEGVGIGQAQMCMNRELVLVGSSPACRIRLREDVISRYHCSLVRTAEGVWLIDLLSRTGTCLNDEPVHWALVKEGDRLRVGPYVLRVWYQQTVGTQTPPTSLPEIRAETPVQSAIGKSESAPPGSFPAPALAVPCVEPSATEITTLASAFPAELDEASERQREAEALRQQLADSQSECDRLRDQVRVFQIQVAEADGLQARLEAATASARELEAVCAERDSWRSEAQALQSRMASDSSEREDLRQRLEAAQLQHIKVRDAEYDAALQRLQEMLDALARSQDEARSLQAELDKARERQQDAEMLRQQLAGSQAECDRLQEQARMVEAQLAGAAGLQARLEAAQAKAGEIEAICAERDSWRSKAQSLQSKIASDLSEREELQQRLEAAQQQLAAERDAVRAAVLRLDQESTTSQQMRADLTTRNAAYDVALQRLQEIQDELARSQYEARSLQNELDQAHERQRDAETLRQQLEDAQAKHDQLCARVPELEGRATSAERLWSQLRNAEEEMEQLRAQLREAESRMADREDMRAECDRHREQALVLGTRVAEAAGLQARLEAAEVKAREIEAVCAERDNWRSKAQALQTRIASDSSEQEELRQRLEVAQQQLATERNAVRELGVRLEKESATVQQVRADFTARNAQYDAALQRLQEIQDTLIRSQDEARSLQAELDQARERQQDAETLRKQLAGSQVECDRLREQTRMVEAQRAEAAGLQARLAAAEVKAREIEAVCAERDNWRSKAQTLQSRMASDSSEREGLRQQLAAERDAVCQLGVRLEKESSTVQQMRADFTARNASYDAALQRLLEIQDELARSQYKERSLQAELAQARERLRDAAVFGQQLADSQGECVRLRDQVRALKLQVAEEANLQARLEVADAKARHFEAACTEREQWQAEAQTLQTRLASLSAERAELQHRLEAGQQQLVEEREAVRAAGVRLDQGSAALQTARADLAARNAEASAALQQLREIQEELSRSRDEARDLQAELDQAREGLRDAEALRQQLAVTQAKHDQLCAHVPVLEGQAAWADRLWDQLRAADTETEQLRVQLRVAESTAAELETMRAECVRLRDRGRTLEIRVAEAAGVQARLEAAEAKARELEAVCAERDRWQNEAQNLETRIASDSTKQEQLDRLGADLHAAQVERDRLSTEQQASQQLVEQACARVTELERKLADAAAAQDRAVAEARAGWESERQAMEARLEQERQANNGATQAAIREAQAQAAAEREEWRQRLESAEKQIIRERKSFQQQSEQLRQQSAILQAERDHLTARLSQVDSSSPAAEARPQNEAWVSDFEYFAARRLADQGRPPLPRENAWGQTEEPGRVSALSQGGEAAWVEAAAGQERQATIHKTPGQVRMQVSEVLAGPEAGGENNVEPRSGPGRPPAAQTDTGEASLPSDAPQDAAAALEGRQLEEDLPPWLPQQTDEDGKRLWRKFLNFVLRK